MLEGTVQPRLEIWLIPVRLLRLLDVVVLATVGRLLRSLGVVELAAVGRLPRLLDVVELATVGRTLAVGLSVRGLVSSQSEGGVDPRTGRVAEPRRGER